MHHYKTDEHGRIGNITMHRGDRLKNANDRFELLFDEFGDVIVYDVLNTKPIFSTGTFGTKASKLIFKGSIILLQTSSDKTIWQGFHQHGRAHLLAVRRMGCAA